MYSKISVGSGPWLRCKFFGLEPWFSGYGWRLMFWRSWVRIPSLYTRWTFFVVTIVLFVKKDVNKLKRGRKLPIFLKNAIFQIISVAACFSSDNRAIDIRALVAAPSSSSSSTLSVVGWGDEVIICGFHLNAKLKCFSAKMVCAGWDKFYKTWYLLKNLLYKGCQWGIRIDI